MYIKSKNMRCAKIGREKVFGILLIIMCYVLSGCGQGKVEIAMKEESVTLLTGNVAQLSVEVITEGVDVSKAKIKWNSQDESVVFVSADGKIQGVNPGNAIVTATSTGNSVSCLVTV